MLKLSSFLFHVGTKYIYVIKCLWHKDGQTGPNFKGFFLVFGYETLKTTAGVSVSGRSYSFE